MNCNKNKPIAFASWSGGKDCALALYKARLAGINVKYILNMANSRGVYSRSHHLRADVLRRQAACMGAVLVQPKAGWDDYEQKFTETLVKLRRQQVVAGVFGDIDLQIHRDWVEKVCRRAGVRPVLPLWLKPRRRLMNELIGAGFKAIVVALRADLLGPQWLGRQIDSSFVRDLAKLKTIDLCGEGGEYHSFVYDGPIFKRPLRFKVGGRHKRGNHRFLDIV